MKSKLVLLVVGAFVGLVIFLLVGQDVDAPDANGVGGEHALAASSEGGGADREAVSTDSPRPVAEVVVAQAEATREQVDAPAAGLRGQVVDEDGREIVGAWVSWTPRRLSQEHSIRAGVGMREILEGSLRVESGSNGRFEFGAESRGEAGVVWVTSRGRLAAWKTVAVGEEEPLVFNLEVGGGQEVLVTRAGGGSLLGAEVLQGGEHGGSPKSGLLSNEDVAMQLYARVVPVPEGGRAVMPGWTGERRYRAVMGELRSFDRFGSGERVELELQDTVQLDGRVLTDAGSEALAGAIMYVLLPDEETGANRYAFATGLDGDGRVQGMRCPWNARGGYLFKVEGPGLVPGEVAVGFTEVGGVVYFELTCEKASSVVFHFTEGVSGEAESADVAGVLVFTKWRDPETFQMFSTIQKVLSDEEGVVRVSNFPAGTTNFSYLKKGYVEGFIDDMNTFEPTDEPVEIRLQPSGSLKVRVLSGGEALPEYDLYFWEQDLTITSSVRARLKADAEGVALLTDLLLGRVWVLAVVEGEPQSAPVLGRVVKGEVSRIEIELPDAVTGVGRVLDSATRLPVTEAVVEIGVGATGMMVGARDDHGEPVGSDGRFELPLFAPSISNITIRAPGYSPLPVMGDVGEDGRIDFGTLFITKMQPFTVRCVSDQPVDWTEYYGQAGGQTWGPQLPLNVDGTYVAEYGRFGENSFTLSTPDGSSIKRSWTLFGDGPWYREVRLAGGSRLAVVLKADEENMPAYLGLEQTLDTDMANAVYVVVDQDAGKGSFSAIDEGGYSLIAYDAAWKTVACSSVEVKRGELNEATLRLDGTRSFVRLLGKDGAPIAGASITLRDPDHMPNLLARSLIANDAGVVELPATSLEELMLDANFPSGGFMAPRRILRPKTEEPLDLVWDGGRGLFLEVFDGEVPLEGLDIWIHESLSGFPAVTLNVPADGHYERPNVGAGRYFAEAHSGWVWNRRVYFDLDDGGTPVRIEFRRLGDLTVRVTDLLDNPVAGVWVELTSDEFGESVGDWLAAGRVTSGTGLVTDEEGEVHLSGLPHGVFTWSTNGQSGGVDVAVGSGTALEVQLKE